MTTKRKGWSYIAGARGTNRVRVYDRGVHGLWLDYVDDDGKRVRSSAKTTDRAEAKAKADTLAAAFLKRNTLAAGRTVESLFDIYVREVSPQKTRQRQLYDRRATQLLAASFGKDRDPSTLSKRDFDKFIEQRRSGVLRPATIKAPRRVGNRAIEQDLKLAKAIFNWGTIAGDGNGKMFLERNPFDKLELPPVTDVKRPMLTSEQYAQILGIADSVHEYMRTMLIVTRETGRRAGSIRKLQWSDLDLERGQMTWRAEFDKERKPSTTALTREAIEALTVHRRLVAKEHGIGGWVFPVGAKSDRYPSKSAVTQWWRKAAKRLGWPEGERLGWHGNRRAFATEMRKVAPADLCHLGGWSNYDTPLKLYIKPSLDAQREALDQREKLA